MPKRLALRCLLSTAACLAAINCLAIAAGAQQSTPMYAVVVPQTTDPLLQNLTIPSTAPTQGMWSTTYPWPLVGIHLSVLPDGRVISFGSPNGQGVQDGRTLDIWDPRQGMVPASHLSISNGQMVDSFCGSATMLPQGTLLLSGGGSAGDGYTSFANTLVQPATSTATRATATLAAQRWYSTMITLADGRALITGGGTPYAIVGAYANPSAAEPNISETPEVYSPGNGWSSLTGANSPLAFGPVNNRGWYPRMWVAPDGNVFGISTEQMWSLNPSGSGSMSQLGTFKTTVDNTALPNVGPTSTAVMYDAGKIMQAGGNGYNNGYPSNSSPYASLIDISKAGQPSVRDTRPMQYARQWANSTVMPDGKVIVTGGSTYADNAGSNAVYPAEIWDPSTENWTLGASAANYRGYHSSVVLLTDGALLSGGGGVPGPVNNLNAEIYYPPYLFTAVNGKATLATRPAIVSLSSNAPDWGSTLMVQTVTTDTVSEVALIGLSSVTHSFNTGQRRIKLTFSQAGSSLQAQIPQSNLLPPGYYQLVVLNKGRVPSAGVIVAVHAAAPPSSSVTALLPVDTATRALESVSDNTKVVRHQNFTGYLDAINPQSGTLDRDDSSFNTRAGLANASCYSFESKNYPGYFLRHYAFRLYLNKNDGSGLFSQDATFCAAAGLNGTGFSLQSFNYPSRYLVSNNRDLWISQPDGTAAFNQQASFLQTEQYLPTDNALHSFANFSIPGELIRHANFTGYISSINGASPALDRSDASFIVHPGNASAACYSFEASNYPGYFLRHANFALRLDQNDKSNQFAQDSTFCLNKGLAGSGFSLTAINYPDHYVRQQNGALLLNQNDNSAQFQTDATFALVPAP